MSIAAAYVATNTAGNRHMSQDHFSRQSWRDSNHSGSKCKFALRLLPPIRGCILLEAFRWRENAVSFLRTSILTHELRISGKPVAQNRTRLPSRNLSMDQISFHSPIVAGVLRCVPSVVCVRTWSMCQSRIPPRNAARLWPKRAPLGSGLALRALPPPTVT